MRIKGSTIKFNKSDSRFADASKKSIKKDFDGFNMRKQPEPRKIEVKEPPAANMERRIASINEKGDYVKFARFIVGKLVRLKRKSQIGNSFYCEFVFDDDRKALNRAAGWSDNKKEYLFDGVKFK